jgi:hypothetical protein
MMVVFKMLLRGELGGQSSKQKKRKKKGTAVAAAKRKKMVAGPGSLVESKEEVAESEGSDSEEVSQ